MVLESLLQRIHPPIIVLHGGRLIIRVHITVQLQELVVKMLLRDWRLRPKYSRLVAAASTEDTVGLHKILLHLVVYNVGLGQLFVFEDLGLLIRSLAFGLLATFKLGIVPILIIEFVWVICLLFRHFNKEIVLIVHLASLVRGANGFVARCSLIMVQCPTTLHVPVIVAFNRNQSFGMLVEGRPRWVLQRREHLLSAIV